MKLSLYPASKAHLQNIDILYSFFIFDWKSKWLKFFSSKGVIGFHNGRTALCYLLQKTRSSLKKEVIISAYTCPTVAQTVEIAGYKVIYCDINYDSGIMSLDTLDTLININTHSIITANTYGALNNVKNIKKMLTGKNIYLFEDITWGIGSFDGNQPIGSYGDASFLSLGLGKNLTVGGGGILLINSKQVQKSFKDKEELLSKPPLSLLTLFKVLCYNALTNKYIYRILHLLLLTPKDFIASIDNKSLLLHHTLSSFRKKLSANALNSYVDLNLIRNFYFFEKIMHQNPQFTAHVPKTVNGFNYSSRRPILLNDTIKPCEFIEYMNSKGYEASRGFYQNREKLDPTLHKNAIKYCEKLVTIPSNYNMSKVELNKMVGLL